MLVELGYAASHLGWDRTILVFNEAFGRVEDLPFDLRTRRVVTFAVEEGGQDKAEERKRLAKVLERAVAAVFSSAQQPLASSDAAVVDLGEYRRRFVSLFGPRAEPHVETRSRAHVPMQRELQIRLRDRRNLCVIGPSGSGKSHALLRFAVDRALDETAVPVFGRVREVGHDPAAWFERNVASCCPEGLRSLEHAAAKTNAYLLLVIDGLNEAGAHRTEIETLIQSFRLRTPTAVVFLSDQREPVSYSKTLDADVVALADPDEDERAALLRVHWSGDRDPPDGSDLEFLRTPFDVALAAAAWSAICGAPTRQALLATYCRTALDEHGRVQGESVLRRAAAEMADRVQRSLALAEVERLCVQEGEPRLADEDEARGARG
ncbi:hypothetical protein L6R52_30695 [Myxococcota bacterium]|nr:hypothetical protein [Myxococcota bacterium]